MRLIVGFLVENWPVVDMIAVSERGERSARYEDQQASSQQSVRQVSSKLLLRILYLSCY